MPDIVCAECNTTVPGNSEYCPECGYPFDIHAPEPAHHLTVESSSFLNQPATAFSPDLIEQSLASLKQEMDDLQKTVVDIKHVIETRSATTTDSIEKSLAELSAKLESLEISINKKSPDGQPAQPEKTKKDLLSAFYKTLNSPNSMFEYMFYICIAQTIFIVVNLFLTAYIVTLIR